MGDHSNQTCGKNGLLELAYAATWKMKQATLANNAGEWYILATVPTHFRICQPLAKIASNQKMLISKIIRLDYGYEWSLKKVTSASRNRQWMPRHGRWRKKCLKQQTARERCHTTLEVTFPVKSNVFNVVTCTATNCPFYLCISHYNVAQNRKITSFKADVRLPRHFMPLGLTTVQITMGNNICVSAHSCPKISNSQSFSWNQLKNK